MRKTSNAKPAAPALTRIGEALIAFGLLMLLVTQVIVIFPESSVLAICGVTSFAIGFLMVALRAQNLSLLLPEVLVCIGMALLAIGFFFHFHRYLLISAGALLSVAAGVLTLRRKRQQQNSGSPEGSKRDVRN